MNSGAFFKSNLFFGGLVTLLFLTAFISGYNPFQPLERKAYDLSLSADRPPADDRIVLVDIDTDSIDRLGRWPWSRAILGEMIEKLSSAGASIIAFDLPPFTDPRPRPAGINSQLQLAELLKKEGKIKEAQKVLAEARAMDEDRVFIEAVRKAGNVLLAFQFETGANVATPASKTTEILQRMAFGQVDRSQGGVPLHAFRARLPFPELANAAAGLGFMNTVRDEDEVVRSVPLTIEYGGNFYPSLPLSIAAKELGLSMRDIRATSGARIELGAMDLATDKRMFFYPVFHGQGQKSRFTKYSFHDVFAGAVPEERLRGKIVIIGASAQGVGSSYITAVGEPRSHLELQADVLQSMLKQHYITRPSWAFYAEIGILLLIGIYLILVLPRLSVVLGATLSGCLLVLLLLGGYLSVVGSLLWIQTVTAAALLIIGHVLMSTQQFLAAGESRKKAATSADETNKMLGLSFQSQGMLDMAFDKFRKCQVNEDILSILYNLALDFERKRQFNKACSVYEYIAEHDPDYKDIQTRIERAKNAGDTLIFGSSSSSGGMPTLLITGGAKPTLGRYEITRELGKGAMGTVYLGKDPKINREVAIKTMALSQEFEPDELEEVKERFFREAETAGRLNHPNIVTIFDAGEEHDLAYIAMEYLNGTDLSPYTKPGKLFSKIAVLKIIGKVAEALHYAHGKGVIHRDIKPANIMILKNKTIKVTDFGIARITAASKTKTGVVLGTPSYMSPEQLSGKHVDGRSDLFSLGVMLYEMLSGTRPFKGDSMATLMFQIANEPHPDIREHCPELPESLAKLIDKMLSKDPQTRIASGNEVVKEIIQCIADLQAMGSGK